MDTVRLCCNHPAVPLSFSPKPAGIAFNAANLFANANNRDILYFHIFQVFGINSELYDSSCKLFYYWHLIRK
mgnify:CR=1 FL=1